MPRSVALSAQTGPGYCPSGADDLASVRPAQVPKPQALQFSPYRGVVHQRHEEHRVAGQHPPAVPGEVGLVLPLALRHHRPAQPLHVGAGEQPDLKVVPAHALGGGAGRQDHQPPHLDHGPGDLLLAALPGVLARLSGHLLTRPRARLPAASILRAAWAKGFKIPNLS